MKMKRRRIASRIEKATRAKRLAKIAKTASAAPSSPWGMRSALLSRDHPGHLVLHRGDAHDRSRGDPGLVGPGHEVHHVAPEVHADLTVALRRALEQHAAL